MNYNDENNLYHYSYRKGDNVYEPVYEPVYARGGAEDPVTPLPVSKPEKKKRGLFGIVALMLVCALIGGAAGAGAMVYFRGRDAGPARSGGPEEITVSGRTAAEVTTVKTDGGKQMTLPEVYDANVDSVVSINTTMTTNIFNQTVQNAASGSGFIITETGYIVTNYHVIEDANTVKVTLYNGETYDAEVIGGDKDYDIAVIKIEADGLPAVTIGDSSTLRIGESIAAIGNPLGELTFSMSEGIVSCVDRAINVDGTPFNMIQVTCAINPGNSGGPLFNTWGEVVGIVSAKYSSYSSTMVEGIGFAIPINDVVAMIEDIMANGYVTNKPYMGISAGTMNATMAQQYRYSVSSGVFVYSVDENGAADRAGLQSGDVIVKLDGTEISSMSDLTAAKKNYSAGDTAEITVYRNDETITLSLTFDATPQDTTSSNSDAGNGNNDDYFNGDTYMDPIDPWEFFNDFFGLYGGNGSGRYNGSRADEAA